MSLTQINKAGLDEIALDHVFTIGASGSSAYTFQGEGLNGTVNNPTLYLTRGKTYRFENGSGGHPIRIQSTSGASGTAYNTGVTNNAGSGTVIVEVQHDAPDVLYYQCTSHSAMNGILYITGALADGGVTTAKLAAGAVTENKIGSLAIVSTKLAPDAVTDAKLSDHASDNSLRAVSTNHIKDEAVTLAKLPHGTSSNDGKFLRANNGADPSFETVTSTNIIGNADNRVITGSGTANTLEGEATLTYNGTDTFELQPASATPANFIGDSNRTGAGQGLVQYKGNWNGTTVARITMDSGSDTTNKDDGIIRFDTAAAGSVAEAMRIDSSGNVGIGTTSPITPLHVKHATTNGVATFESGDATCLINFKDNSTTDSPSLGAEANNFKLITSGTERIRIDSSGSVNIGSTGGFDSNGDDLTITNGGHGGISIRTGNTSDGVLRFGDGSGADEYRGYINYRHFGDKFLIGTSGAQRLSIDSDGLKFGSDTAAANALDDYEEGTFTATCGNGVTLHPNADRLSYTKIGRQVTVSGQIQINNSNGDSDLIINNLPFASGSNGEDSSVSIGATRTWGWDLPSDTIDVICMTSASSANLEFWRNRDNTTANYLDADGGAYIGFTITYFTS